MLGKNSIDYTKLHRSTKATVISFRPYRSTIFLVAGITVLVLLAGLGGDAARLALRYQRDAVIGGEWWRVMSAHLVHLGWSHTILNLLGLWLLAALFADVIKVRDWLWTGVASAICIGAGLLFFEAHLQWYVGLSGVLHGWFAAGAVAMLMRRQRGGTGLILGLIIKLIWEQWQGALPLTAAASGGPVVVAAHLYGAAGGLIMIALRRWPNAGSRPPER